MNLKKGAHVHLIGICGTAMASLAGLLKTQGYKVTGSDQNVYPPMSTQLHELGIQIMQGYKKENLNTRPDLVIVGNVISRGNEEAAALLQTDIPYTSLPKAMGEFAIGERDCIVIAGTHGKTTTTSMMAFAADTAGHKPGFMIGGIPENYGLSFRVSQDNYFVIEGDEYDTAFFDKVPKFIHYKPKYVILTSVEFDHADIYADLEAVKVSFRKLIDLIPADGILVANTDEPNVRELVQAAKCKVIKYGAGRDTSAHYQVTERAQISGRNHFAVSFNGQKIADVAMKSPGEYNALNAIAVFALARELKWNTNQILQGLANFKGVKRRQQVLGSPGGVTIIEDFAHHPTAVKVTIEAVSEQYGESKARIFALFEPRSATSRRKIFQKDYVNAFKRADFIFIAKPYDQSKISETERFSSEELVNDISKSGKVAKEFTGTEAIVAAVKAEAKKGDVVLVMSNGAFDGIYQKLLAAL
jgi:UDP-N-acetylmuramate: L-alanyl-gamma-D-glutamyl-meso-diaminopimelate ligase